MPRTISSFTECEIISFENEKCLNVLMVSTGRGKPPDSPKGGVENEAYQLVASMAKYVKSIHYVESFGQVNLPENVFIYEVGFTQRDTPTFVEEVATSPFLAFMVANAARKALTSHRVDILHFHETRGNLPFQFLSGFSTLPKVLSIHGPVPWTVNYNSKIETLVRSGTYRIFDMCALRKANHLIAISHWIKRSLVNLGVPENKVSVIYNPVDTSLFSPQRKLEKRNIDVLHQLKLEPSSYYLAVGSLVSRKRYIDLIRAFALYKGEKKLVIVGDGPELYNLYRAIQKYDIGGRVKMIRHVNASFLPYLYASARAFVTCSIAEGLPVTIMEAMSSGLGIISPERLWIGELVDRKNGVLFPSVCAPEAATDAINSLDDEVTSERLGLASRHIAEKIFSQNSCATQTLKVYESVIDKKHNSQMP